MNQDQAKIIYQQLIELWKQFCERHSDLFNLAVDEYQCLLASDMDQLNVILDQKNELLHEISNIENERQRILNKVQELTQVKMDKIYDLITYLENEYGLSHHLERYNETLIEIIEKIQMQNKKNQLFLNKALLNISQLKKEFALSKKSVETYNRQGEKVTSAR